MASFCNFTANCSSVLSGNSELAIRGMSEEAWRNETRGNGSSATDCEKDFNYEFIIRIVILSVQAFCILGACILGIVVFRFRKSKVIVNSTWLLLELLLTGAIFIYSTVLLRFLQARPELCLVQPWIRELGFTLFYGSITLKIYRLLVEFRTRKAHRWVVREKDLLKYLAIMLVCVWVYLTSGTTSTLQHCQLDWNVSWVSPPPSPSVKHSNIGRSEAGIRLRGDSIFLNRHVPESKTMVDNSTFFQGKARATSKTVSKTIRKDATMGRFRRSAEESLVTFTIANLSDNLSANETNHSSSDNFHRSLMVAYQGPGNDVYWLCQTLWWHYVNIAGEWLFLLCGLYLGYSTRNAASGQEEKFGLAMVLLLEFLVSMVMTALHHFTWIQEYPNNVLILEFCRTHLTITLGLLIIFGPKLWYTCQRSTVSREKTYQLSQLDTESGVALAASSTPSADICKLYDGLSVTVNVNGEVEVGNVDLMDMDPEVIREELKRVYTQLHVLKMKTLRKDNPHISKRRGGRKATHRRFSLQRNRGSREKSLHGRNTRSMKHLETSDAPRTPPEESVCSVDGPNLLYGEAATEQLTPTCKGQLKF